MTELNRLLVAVADSPASLAAARTAIALAVRLGAELRVVHVVTDGALVILLRGTRSASAAPGEDAADVVPVLRHVADLAQRAGVRVSTVRHEGDAGTCILDEARDWAADLVVVGRSPRRGAGDPFIGVEAQRVLEFSDRPVLVVPGPP
jgi:nucleotide-binding universal stress UspA family protein